MMAKGGHAGVLYREVQRFRQPWLWALVLAVAGLALYGLVQQVFLGRPFGNNPAPDAVVVAIAVFFGLGFPAFFRMLNLTTEVRGDGLYIRFFPFHRSFRRIPLADLINYEVRTYSAVREYGGWGIRYGRQGKAYNVSGNRGVQLEMSGGERLLIGSRRPDELAGAIGAALRGVVRAQPWD